VQTEDHPLEYGKFKGTIPEGEYGAGEVFIWDHGTWEPEGDVEAAFRKGHIEFTLKGKKLSGRWRLIRPHYKGSSDQKSWLLMKSSDEVIKSQMQDRWPGFIAPQLPQLVTEPPEGEKWLHEMKFDGYRMQAHLQNGIALFYTRNGLNWSNSFPHLLEGVGKLKASSLILDGEIVALDEEGRSHFQRLQNSMTTKKDKDLRYYVFDILYQDGEDLRKIPLHERKERLRNLLKHAPSNILFSEHFEEGEEFFKLSCEHQLEGIVSKIADSPYRSGRNKLWSKAKCSFRQEFVIGGYSDPQGGRAGFGALLLGVYEGNHLRFVGKVGTGFSQQSLKDLKKQLADIHAESSPFDLNSPKGRNIHWVEPIKVAEVSFSQWTNEGILRTPVFLGLREDKPAKDIHVENVTPTDKRNKQVTSPDKVLFKKEKITKKEIAQFYQAIAPHMLPYMKDRPLSMVRCPDGSEGTCFYQKHISGKIPEAFTTFPVMEGKGEGIYLSINSADGLFELVQLNAFELHAWNCQRDDVMHPDQIVMDFDPGPGVAWKEVVSAAFELKALLEELNLKSFVKLTGGKGIHVHVPIAPVYDWDQIKSFSQTLALQLVSMNPKKYVANMAKNQLRGKSC